MRKHNLITILTTQFFILSLALSYTHAASNECRDDSLKCFYTNFDELYKKDYEYFWKILNDSAEKAIRCKNTTDTTDFIKLANITNNNVEFFEFINQRLEELCVNSSACFFKSLSKVDHKTANIIINKLKKPLFEDKKELDQVFKKYSSNLKYKFLSDIYFSK